ncbi:MAG: transposase [Phycisphaerales bacterium]|nr:transposase [Phycisphaerales bacterium]
MYECFIDGTFAKARGGGDGIGRGHLGKGVKIMVLVDARGLPVAIDTAPADAHESRCVQALFDFVLTRETPPRVIGDKAYDSDKLDEELAQRGMEMIAPHRGNRKPENVTQDRRPLQRQAALDGGADDLLDPELPPALHPLGEVELPVQRLLAYDLYASLAFRGFEIASWLIVGEEVGMQETRFDDPESMPKLASRLDETRLAFLSFVIRSTQPAIAARLRIAVDEFSGRRGGERGWRVHR